MLEQKRKLLPITQTRTSTSFADDCVTSHRPSFSRSDAGHKLNIDIHIRHDIANVERSMQCVRLVEFRPYIMFYVLYILIHCNEMLLAG